MVDYEQYYDRHVECDFCGQMTRGRIWAEEPTKVKCGACHHVLTEKGTKSEKSSNHSGSTRNRQNNNAAENR